MVAGILLVWLAVLGSAAPQFLRPVMADEPEPRVFLPLTVRHAPAGGWPLPPDARTLIITDEDSVARLFSLAPDDPELVAWRNALLGLAAHSSVRGWLITDLEAEASPDVRSAYRTWQQNRDPSQTNRRANAVAQALHDWIWQLRDTSMPGLQYVVLAADDRVIPHYRLRIDPPTNPDEYGNWETEDVYYAEGVVGAGTTVGAALAADYTLTDDFFGARAPADWGVADQRFFMPEIAVGRLVERPADMTAAVRAFLERDGRLIVSHALLVGYDLMQDAAEVADRHLAAAGLGEAERTRFIGSGWTSDTLRAALLGPVRHDLVFVAAHAKHYGHETPRNGVLYAREIAESSADLAGVLAYGLACHGGLNVPGAEHPEPMDFPEAWLGRGAVYLGSPGFAYGQTDGLQWDEALMARFTEELTRPGATLGDAFLAARRAYKADMDGISAMHLKTLNGNVLYGVPAYRIEIRPSGR